MNIDDMILVLTAYKEGQTIQFLAFDEPHWKDCRGDPVWAFNLNEYRVKPEPREWYAVVEGYSILSASLDTNELNTNLSNTEVIKVREVLDDE